MPNKIGDRPFFGTGSSVLVTLRARTSPVCAILELLNNVTVAGTTIRSQGTIFLCISNTLLPFWLMYQHRSGGNVL